jgi:hypothetical protein
LEEHNGSVNRELLLHLLATNRAKDAVQFGKAALYSDLEGALTHAAYARALAASGDHQQAEFEFESAIVCPGAATELASAHLQYGEYLKARGKQHRARQQLELAKKLDPSLRTAPAVPGAQGAN